jgi:phosphocarrier protein
MERWPQLVTRWLEPAKNCTALDWRQNICIMEARWWGVCQGAIDMAVVSEKVVIVNEKGMHARSATTFMTLASGFRSEVSVQRIDTGEVSDGKSIMSLLKLALACGTEIEIQATGADAQAAVDGLVMLVQEKFLE